MSEPRTQILACAYTPRWQDETVPALGAAGRKVSGRRGTGGWEDLLDLPADQRGSPPTPAQLALLQEQVPAPCYSFNNSLIMSCVSI